MIVDYTPAENLIVASHITGIYDVNRNNVLANDDFSLISDWAKSITTLGLNGIIFHNDFSDLTCKLYQSDSIQFVKIDYNQRFNPNVFRYFIYAEFLKQYAKNIKNIFFTDITDVVVINNPFQTQLFLANPGTIFCGDEPKILENEWMQKHSEHLRNKIPDYAKYETAYKKETLLNCGIIGGGVEQMFPFIEKLWAIHREYNSENSTPYTGDMGAFNYLIRTLYSNRVIHGYPVNTPFKSYSLDQSCWFKHK